MSPEVAAAPDQMVDPLLAQEMAERAQQIEHEHTHEQHDESLPDLTAEVHERQDHTIEMKDAHPVTCDCPDHDSGSHKDHSDHHEEHEHHDHKIEMKAAEHVCGADCAGHGSKHKDHHEEHHDKHAREHDHSHEGIDIKTHPASCDCPDHGSKHGEDEAHRHTEKEHHDHHHEHSEKHENTPLHVELKEHPATCDCPDHSNHVHESVPEPKKEREVQAIEEIAQFDRELSERLERVQRENEATVAEVIDKTKARPFATEVAHVEPGEAMTTELETVRHTVSDSEIRRFLETEAPKDGGTAETPESTVATDVDDVEVHVADAITDEEIAVRNDEVLDIDLHEDGSDAALLSELAAESTNQTPGELTSEQAIETGETVLVTEKSEDAPGSTAAEASDTELAAVEALFDPTELEELVAIFEAIEHSEVAEMGVEGSEIDLTNDNDAEMLPIAVPEIRVAGDMIENEKPLVLDEIKAKLDELLEQVNTDSSEVAELIQSSATRLVSLLESRAMTAQEKARTVLLEALRLLSILGFERPKETLSMYLHRYGYAILDDILAHLFELMSGFRESFEAIKSLSP